MESHASFLHLSVCVGGHYVALKHDIESLEGAIALWMMANHSCTSKFVDVAFNLLHSEVFHMLPCCDHLWDVMPGTRCQGNQLAFM